MVVLVISNCSPQLRGTISRWMIEVDSGVYVGKLNQKVREALWNKVCKNIATGQASMIYSSNTEQGYSFLTHNTLRKPVDYDGLNLIKKYFRPPAEQSCISTLDNNTFFQSTSNEQLFPKQYVILDLETTGLDPVTDRIIEVGLLKINSGIIIEEYQCFVKHNISIPRIITSLTGITNEMIINYGIPESELSKVFNSFIEDNTVVGYNIKFDLDFLENLMNRTHCSYKIFNSYDVLKKVRTKFKGLDKYSLSTVYSHLFEQNITPHRALNDCLMIKGILDKLNEF